MPITCLKFSEPALIKIIAIIITADDESRAMVTIIPMVIEENMFRVYREIISCAFAVKIFWRILDNLRMAYKNIISPPISDAISIIKEFQLRI